VQLVRIEPRPKLILKMVFALEVTVALVSSTVGDLCCVEFGAAILGERFEKFVLGEGGGAFGFLGFFVFWVFFGRLCCYGERSVCCCGGGIADGEVWFWYGLEDIGNRRR